MELCVPSSCSPSLSQWWLSRHSLRLEIWRILDTQATMFTPSLFTCFLHIGLPSHLPWPCHGSSSCCLISVSLISWLCRGIEVSWPLYITCHSLFLQQQYLNTPSYSSPTPVSRHTSAPHALSQLHAFAPAVHSIWYISLLALCMVHTTYLSLALSLLLLQRISWFPQAKLDAPLHVSCRLRFYLRDFALCFLH